jgi:putative transposase
MRHDISLNTACQLMSISKTAYYYKPKKRAADTEIEGYLQSMAERHKRWGLDKMMLKIKNEKRGWNHKRVHRIYCELGLNIRIKPRKRIPKGEATALLQTIHPNICWSMDFMSDVLYHGRKFRMFNVIDDYNREALMVKPSYSLPANKVVHLLDVIASARGYPKMIRVDNGTEFTSIVFKRWAAKHNILVHYIQPGKPAQNGFVERFNRTFREDVLDMNWFAHLQEVMAIARDWVEMYNQERPHESLAGLAPIAFARQRQKRLANKLENSISN